VIDAADHRVMAFGGNARAEAHEFVDVAKATDEQVPVTTETPSATLSIVVMSGL